MTTTISHQQFGAGPPVVLLHPSAFGPELVRPFAERLAAAHRVIVPHRRGYDLSAGLRPATSLDEHHDDLADLLDLLELDRPMIIGVSAGATLALGFASRERDRDTVTIAHEPLLGPLAPTLHARVTARIARLLARADQPHETSLFMSELVGITTWNHLSAARRNDVETNGAIAQHEASLFAEFALSAGELDDLGERAVYTTVGSRSGEMRQEAATVLAGHGIERFVIDGASHLPFVETPDAYVRLVRDVGARRVEPDVIGSN
jgi:pimeloyl-ACP methyl ester carboxylesterase